LTYQPSADRDPTNVSFKQGGGHGYTRAAVGV
jgi:hypothetical protein